MQRTSDRTEAPDVSRAAPLVMHQGAIGDTIQLTALLRALSVRYGLPCDVVTGQVPAGALFAGLTSVGEIRRLSHRRLPYPLSREQQALRRWLRARGPGPVWVVERWRHRVAPWSRLTRCEWLLERAGVPAACRVTTLDAARAPLEHAVDYFLRLASIDPPAFRAAPPPPADPATLPELVLAPDELADCRAWLERRGRRGEPLVLFQATSRRTKRGRWPDQRWAELARRILAARPDAWVVLVGAPFERRETARLAALVDDRRCVDVAAELPLRRLFALVALAHSLVSLDTATAHAAAALGCPAVVLAGSADPRRNVPRGEAPLELVTAFDGAWPEDGRAWFERHDPARIATDAVLDAWRRVAPAAAAR